jgi:hypothetical protein
MALRLLDQLSVRDVEALLQEVNVQFLTNEIDHLKKVNGVAVDIAAERTALKDALVVAEGDYSRATRFGLGMAIVFALGGAALFYNSRRWKDRVVWAEGARATTERKVQEYADAFNGIRRESQIVIDTLQEECDQRAHVSIVVYIPEENETLRKTWGETAAFAKMQTQTGTVAIMPWPCVARPRAVEENVIRHLASCDKCAGVRRGNAQNTKSKDDLAATIANTAI